MFTMLQTAVLPLATSCQAHPWGIKALLFLLIGGIIIGLLGKFVAPGDRDNIPLWLTVVCGIGGMLLGNVLYTALGGSCHTSGIDWLRHITQVIVAAILVVIAAAMTSRRSRV